MTKQNNATQHEDFVPTSGIPLDTIPAIVFMTFILLINGGVILLIGCYSNLRTTSNIILASLAVSDFLVGFVGIPLVVACSATFVTPVCLSASIFFTFISLSTVLHITVMTCDRYIYIMWAMRYRDIVHRWRIIAVLSMAWLISLTSLVRLSWILHFNIETAKEDAFLVKEKELTYLIFNLTLFSFIPLIVMVVLDARMLLLLRRQCQRIARENLPVESVKHERKMQKRQKRVVFTCALLLILYVAFWFPYFILELLQYYATEDKYGIPNFVVTLITYLRFCPSLFNPVAYTLRKPDLKRTVKSITYKIFPPREPHHTENRTEQIHLSSRTDV